MKRENLCQFQIEINGTLLVPPALPSLTDSYLHNPVCYLSLTMASRCRVESSNNHKGMQEMIKTQRSNSAFLLNKPYRIEVEQLSLSGQGRSGKVNT